MHENMAKCSRNMNRLHKINLQVTPALPRVRISHKKLSQV